MKMQATFVYSTSKDTPPTPDKSQYAWIRETMSKSYSHSVLPCSRQRLQPQQTDPDSISHT